MLAIGDFVKVTHHSSAYYGKIGQIKDIIDKNTYVEDKMALFCEIGKDYGVHLYLYKFTKLPDSEAFLYVMEDK